MLIDMLKRMSNTEDTMKEAYVKMLTAAKLYCTGHNISIDKHNRIIFTDQTTDLLAMKDCLGIAEADNKPDKACRIFLEKFRDNNILQMHKMAEYVTETINREKGCTVACIDVYNFLYENLYIDWEPFNAFCAYVGINPDTIT